MKKEILFFVLKKHTMLFKHLLTIRQLIYNIYGKMAINHEHIIFYVR